MLASNTSMDVEQLPDEELHVLHETLNQNNESVHQWKSLFKAGIILMTVCLVIGLHVATPQPEHFHNSARKLSAKAAAVENVTKPEYTSGNKAVSTSAVNTLCVCNPTSTKMFIYISLRNRNGELALFQSDWVWNDNPCTCLRESSLATHAADSPIRCSYFREGEHQLYPCQGNNFNYRSSARVAGLYSCTGSPPQCGYAGLCELPRCGVSP